MSEVNTPIKTCGMRLQDQGAQRGAEQKTPTTSICTQKEREEALDELRAERSGRANDLRGSLRTRYGQEADGADLVRALEAGHRAARALASRATALCATPHTRYTVSQ